jgi:indole-3-glycerol phosphate synthase
VPNSFLSRILTATAARLPAVRERRSHIEAMAKAAPPVRDVVAALSAPGLQIIAEIKRRSPSAGRLAGDLDAASQASRYRSGGAAAISVLTEPEFFDGSLGDLDEARRGGRIPVLRKDFLIDPIQVVESRAAGADAVLLIVAALEGGSLIDMMDAVAESGMTALVEVHTCAEAERALAVGATVIGVNNRDLTTFVTDLGIAERLAPCLDGARVRVAESGMSAARDAHRMAAAGYDAVLAGEVLVRAPDPAAIIRSWRNPP